MELRRHIGYVIQQIGLFPNMTVAQNICVVPKLLKYDKARCDQIVQEMLQLVPHGAVLPTSIPPSSPADSSSASACCGPWRPLLPSC